MIELLLLALTLGLLWWWIRPDAEVIKYGDEIPGPVCYPIVGNLLNIPLVGSAALKKQAEMVKEYGRIIRLWMGNLLVVTLYDADDVEVLLKSQTQIDKLKLYEFTYPWLGTGLLTSSGLKWRARRKAITPAFHFKILDNFIEVFNRNGSILVERLKLKTGEEAFNILPYISSYTLDIICETAMGTQMGSQSGNNKEYHEAVRSICELLGKRFNTPLLHNDLIYYLFGYKSKQDKLIEVLKAQTNKVIQLRKEEISKAAPSVESSQTEDLGIKKKTAFLELLLNMRNNNSVAFRSDEDIQEEVDTFMFEGHDTTTSGICFALYLLAANPHCQEELYRELSQKYSENDCNPTMDELNQLQYLDMVVKEVERICPSVPTIGRKITENLKLPSGYTLPNGSLVVVNIYHLHKHEKWFPNPDTFNPERFLPSAVASRHPFAYVPFSAGPRNCIGQKFAMLELKATVAKLVLNFKLECDPNTEMVIDSNLVLCAENGPMIKFSKRN